MSRLFLFTGLIILQFFAAGFGETLKYTKLSIRDPGINNIEAVTMLIPAGWKTEGGIFWRPNNYAMATLDMKIYNPAGAEMLRPMPTDTFTWQQGGIPFIPIGSNYLGNDVYPPPQQPVDFVTKFVIPRYRREIGEFKVIKTEELPKLADAVLQVSQEAGVNKACKALRVRVEYSLGGKMLEEDYYCTLIFATTPMMPQLVLWSSERLYSFRAEKGRLDKLTPMLQVSIKSTKVSLEWFAGYAQVMQLFQQRLRQGLANAKQLSEYVTKINNEISDMQRQAYEDRMASQDRISKNFSQYIRGIDEYKTPTGGTVELPSGYNYAWANKQGEYILTDEHGFNPNEHSNQTWEPLQK